MRAFSRAYDHIMGRIQTGSATIHIPGSAHRILHEKGRAARPLGLAAHDKWWAVLDLNQ
jgi:hypothetical protein